MNLIFFPSQWIDTDIRADPFPFLLVPDDVFVIIPLPERRAGAAGSLVDLAAGDRFEIL